MYESAHAKLEEEIFNENVFSAGEITAPVHIEVIKLMCFSEPQLQQLLKHFHDNANAKNL